MNSDQTYPLGLGLTVFAECLLHALLDHFLDSQGKIVIVEDDFKVL